MLKYENGVLRGAWERGSQWAFTLGSEHPETGQDCARCYSSCLWAGWMNGWSRILSVCSTITLLFIPEPGIGWYFQKLHGGLHFGDGSITNTWRDEGDSIASSVHELLTSVLGCKNHLAPQLWAIWILLVLSSDCKAPNSIKIQFAPVGLMRCCHGFWQARRQTFHLRLLWGQIRIGGMDGSNICWVEGIDNVKYIFNLLRDVPFCWHWKVPPAEFVKITRCFIRPYTAAVGV